MHLAFVSLVGLALTVGSTSAHATTTSSVASAELALFDADVPTITGASRRRQSLDEVPASVTVITAENIRKHGWSSLGEVLSHVRGFYVTDDLNYQYVGVRGFMRPGDYNSRVLVLLDGHPLNDPVYLAATIGRDALELGNVERIEVIRGPGSALYGTSALLAVINVVTRTGPDPRTLDGAGVEVSATADSLGRGSTTVSFDRWLAGETRVALSVAALGAIGQRYTFPELGLATATARASDREGGVRVFGLLSRGPLRLRLGFTERSKNTPTAAFDTQPESGLSTTDGRLFVAGFLDLEPADGVLWSTHLAVDYAYYSGYYPYADGDVIDYSRGALLTAESVLVTHPLDELVISAGVSAQHSFALDAWAEAMSEPFQPRDFGYAVLGVFADGELRILPELSLYAGARLDYYQTFGAHLSPRLALVAEPWSGFVGRLAYGAAYRAPSVYELYYHDASGTQEGNPRLRPETLAQLEGSIEQALLDGAAHVGVDLFQFEIAGIIDSYDDPRTDVLTYANAGTARTTGGELWADAHLPVLDAHVEVSYSASYAVDVDTGTRLTASPVHLLAASTDLALGPEGLRLGATARYIGARRTIAGDVVPGAMVVDASLSWHDLVPGFDAAIGVKNALDTTWYAPGGAEHRQSRLPQDGTSAWLRLSSGF